MPPLIKNVSVNNNFMADNHNKQFGKFSDNVFVRTYLVVLGMFFFFAAVMVGLSQTNAYYNVGVLIITFLSSIGAYFLIISIIAKPTKARSIAYKSGNHWALSFLIVLATLITSIIKRSSNAH